MKAVTVDDEKLILEDFVSMLEEMEEIDEVNGFTDGNKAMEYIKNNDVDVIFLDIKMRGMDGLTMAEKILEIKPKSNIIFLTAYDEYGLDAIRMHASGYLVKPAIEEEVRRELKNLRNPVTPKAGKRMQVRCFGNFEVFIDGKPCQFKYAKTRELLAYLVDRRGSMVTNGEILGALWEERNVTSSLENYLRNLVGDLRAKLKENDLEDVLIKQRGMMGVATDLLECDYYNWMDGDKKKSNAFNGEYMSQYSWAEITLASLENVML